MTNKVSYLRIAAPNYSEVVEDVELTSSIRSVRRLAKLNYDPLERLVAHAQKLEMEEERQVELREGRVISLDAQGKPVKYSPYVHNEILNMIHRVNNDLMRYGYGRVPETVNMQPMALPDFNIRLELSPDDLTS